MRYLYTRASIHHPIRVNWHPLEAAGIGTYCIIMVYICKAWVSNVWIRSVGSSVPFSVFFLIFCLRRNVFFVDVDVGLIDVGRKTRFYIQKNGTFVKMGIFQTRNQPGNLNLRKSQVSCILFGGFGGRPPCESSRKIAHNSISGCGRGVLVQDVPVTWRVNSVEVDRVTTATQTAVPFCCTT